MRRRGPTRLVVPALALAVFLAAAPQEAPRGTAPGAIRGRVDARAILAGEGSPQVASLGSLVLTDTADRRQSVVYLESAPQGAFEDRAVRAVMSQVDETFVPYVLPVMVGSTVDFPNQDKTFHNVFSLSRVKSFDLGRYPRGESKSVRFDHPGVVRVFCEIHSRMSAYILVFAHRFFAATDGDGRYHIDGVPPGTYDVSVWTDGRVRETRQVRVTEGNVSEAEFTIR